MNKEKNLSKASGRKSAVDAFVMWCRFPENINQSMRPWYAILWRFIWLIPQYIGIAIIWLSTLMTDGLNKANKQVKKI